MPFPAFSSFRRWFTMAALVASLAAPGVAAATAATIGPKKVLVVTVTTGFRHSSIETGEKVVAELAARSGQFTVDFVRQPAGAPKTVSKPRPGKDGVDAPAHQAALKKYEADFAAYQAAYAQWLPSAEAALAKLAPASLQAYDAVVFLNTTGDLPLPDKQGFLDWIAAGHGFVGIHSATDTFHGFPAFIAMIGGEFLTHGPQVSVECRNEDHDHAATKHLPARWTLFDEIYQFKNFERTKVHGLLRLDQHPNNGTPGDYPVAWCKQFGTGRVFYTSLGHREDLWDPAFAATPERKNSVENAARFQQHVLGGILWALGLAEGSAALDAAPKP